MLSLSTCRELLGPDNAALSDAALADLRCLLYGLAEAALDAAEVKLQNDCQPQPKVVKLADLATVGERQ